MRWLNRPPTAQGGHITGRKTWLRAACGWLFASDAFAPLRSQRPRRVLAVGFGLVLAAFPLVGWATGREWPVLLLLIPFAAGMLLLAAATQGMLDRPARYLDERELLQRRTLFREPYITGASIGLVGGMVAVGSFGAGGGVMMGALLAIVGFIYGLPMMMLAWKLPDLTHDEE